MLQLHEILRLYLKNLMHPELYQGKLCSEIGS